MGNSEQYKTTRSRHLNSLLVALLPFFSSFLAFFFAFFFATFFLAFFLPRLPRTGAAASNSMHSSSVNDLGSRSFGTRAFFSLLLI